MQVNEHTLGGIKTSFEECTQVLAAIGDETRQMIFLAMIASGCDGMRVGEITAKTHLSRPAVSHHLKILKDSGIVKVYKVTTKNYYYLDPSGWLPKLELLLGNLREMLDGGSSK